MKFKRIVARLSTVAFLLSFLPVSAALNWDREYYHLNEVTIPGLPAWAGPAISRWLDYGVIQNPNPAVPNNPASLYQIVTNPNAPVTKAEFMAMLVRILGGTVPDFKYVTRFSDLDPLDPDQWYYREFAIACNMGITDGSPDGRMRPDDSLTRQDAFTMIGKALGMYSGGELFSGMYISMFPDAAQISDYAQIFVDEFAGRGWVQGDDEGFLRPRDFVTCADAAVMLDNIFTYVYMPTPSYSTSGYSDVFLKGNFLINQSGTIQLTNLKLEGDLIIGDGVGDGSVLLTNCDINGRLVIRGGGENSVTIANTNINESIYIASFAETGHPNSVFPPASPWDPAADRMSDGRTRIAITDRSRVHTINAVSGFTLSGSGLAGASMPGGGVLNLTILDNAREFAVVDLNGVTLDELNIGGRGCEVYLNEGRVVNARVNGAGQNAVFNINHYSGQRNAGAFVADRTLVENLEIAAPNVRVHFANNVRNLLVNNDGAVIDILPPALAAPPQFFTVGINLSALVVTRTENGPITNQAVQWGPIVGTPNLIDRVNTPGLAVKLLPRYESLPFALYCNMNENRSANDINVTQAVSGVVQFTPHPFLNWQQIVTSPAFNREAYWVGFFIPAPPGTDRDAASPSITLTGRSVAGIPNTFAQDLVLDPGGSGQVGLVMYFPVSPDPASGTPDTLRNGQIDESIYINWNNVQTALTEYLHFTSINLNLPASSPTARAKMSAANTSPLLNSVLTVAALTEEQIEGLQRGFDEAVFINMDGFVFRGSEAQRRILASDNPLGLVVEGNLGLRALNRAITIQQFRNILEDKSFSADLGTDTSSMSVYARLSEEGKLWVASEMLRGRGSGGYATAAAAKTVFDRAVRLRLQEEASLLAQINKCQDYAQLRKLIEVPANAATLDFQTGALPYVNFPTSQKDDMFKFLLSGGTIAGVTYKGVPYSSIDDVIKAIKAYLRQNETPRPPGPDDFTVTKVTANPSSVTMVVGDTREVTLTVTATVNGKSRELTPDEVALLEIAYSWPSSTAGISAAEVTKRDKNKITIRGTSDGTRAVVMTVSIQGKTCNVSILVSPLRPGENLTLVPTSKKMIVGDKIPLTATLTPNTANEIPRASSDKPGVATVAAGNSNGNKTTFEITAVSKGVAVIRVELENGNYATCTVMVFESEDDVIVDPDNITLTPGTSEKITAITYRDGARVFWASADNSTATVDQTGTIRAPVGVDISGGPRETQVTATVGSRSAVVQVTVKALGAVIGRLERSVMYSGETQQLYLEVSDPAMRNTKFYVQVTGGIGGVAARCASTQPAGINDEIIIQANEIGVGEATILLFTNPSFTGAPVSDPLKVVVSPMSVDDVRFRHTGAFVLPNGDLKYPKDSEIEAAQYGAILEMRLNENVTVTPVVPEPGVMGGKIDLPQPMTWFSYDCDYNREIMREVMTVYDNGNFYLLNKSYTGPQDRFLYGTPGTPVNFTSAFYQDIDDTPAAPVDGQIVPRAGYFLLTVPSALKYAIQRDADIRRVASPLLGVARSGASGRLQPDVTQPTGFAAVAMTPERGNLTNEQLQEWGTLFYNTADLFVSGVFNPAIARQSQFQLEKNVNGTWINVNNLPVTDQDYQKDIYYTNFTNDIASGKFRIVDINGVVLTGRVPAIVDGDPNEQSNVFYVRIVPNDMPTPNDANRTERILWSTPLGVPNPDAAPPVFFQPGSRDEFNYGTGVQQYPYLVPQKLRSSTMNTENISIGRLGGNYVAFFEIFFKPTPPPPNSPDIYEYSYILEQYSKLGFAPVGATAPRQPAIQSETPILTFRVEVYSDPPTPPDPPPQVQMYAGASYTSMTLDPTGTFSLLYGYLRANGFSTGDISNLFSYTTAPNSLLISNDTGVLNIVHDAANQRNYIQVAATASGRECTLTIKHPDNSLGIANIIVPVWVVPNPVSPPSPPSPSGGGTQGAPAPTPPGAFSVETIPVAASAAAQAGINLETATFASGAPNILAMDTQGTAIPVESGKADITITAADGAKSTKLSVDVVTPAQAPAVPKSAKLRSSATVAEGASQILLPYFDTASVDLKTVTWTSSNDKVATVDANGVVTGLKAGKATIRMTVEGTKLKDSCAVTVVKPGGGASSITLSKTALALDSGKSSTLTVKYQPTNAAGRGVTWVSSNESVARVGPTGAVTGVGAGTAVITAVCDLTGASAKCEVTVTVAASGVKLDVKTLSLKVGDSAALTFAISPYDVTDKSVTWKSSNTKAVTVDANGNLSAVGAGTATITVRTANGKTDTCKVTVKK